MRVWAGVFLGLMLVAPPVSTAVPVMPLWLLILMMLGLVALGLRYSARHPG